MRTCGFRNIVRMLTVAAVTVSPLAISACSMDRPTWVNGQRVELHQSSETTRLPVSEINDARLAGIAAHYRSSGEGAVYVTVTYDPKSKSNTAMKASGEAARISTYLRRKGAAEVTSDILPINNSGNNSEALITYDAVTAHAPRDCNAMGGLDGGETHSDEDYRYGCTIEMQLARQIANPKDLKGRDGLRPEEADGRRQANIVEDHRTGEPNAALEGESASQ